MGAFALKRRHTVERGIHKIMAAIEDEVSDEIDKVSSEDRHTIREVARGLIEVVDGLAMGLAIDGTVDGRRIAREVAERMEREGLGS